MDLRNQASFWTLFYINTILRFDNNTTSWQSREFPTTAHQGGGEVREATVWGFQVFFHHLQLNTWSPKPATIYLIFKTTCNYMYLIFKTPQWRKSSTRCGLHVAEAKASVAGRWAGEKSTCENIKLEINENKYRIGDLWNLVLRKLFEQIWQDENV